MAKRYDWRHVPPAKMDAQMVGEELLKIQVRNDGWLERKKVVDAARSDKHPLHKAFVWDDKIAGEKYREQQAGELIRHVVNVIEREGGEPLRIRAFVSVERGDQRAFVDVDTAMSRVDLRNQVLRRALREAQEYRQRYDGLSELAEVFEAIDKTKGVA